MDVTFGDYLRALVTADQEIVAVDLLDQRGALIEAFRLRGIYPDTITSLAEESVVWEPARARFPQVPIVSQKLAELVNPSSAQLPPDHPGTYTEVDFDPINVNPQQAAALYQYAKDNATALQLAPDRPPRVQGFHFLFRTGQDGRPRFELVAQFVQTDGSLQDELGGIPFRGGTTLIAQADGTVKYVISKPLGGGRSARQRLERQRAFTRRCALRDPLFSWHGHVEGYQRHHMAARMNLALVHGRVYR